MANTVPKGPLSLRGSRGIARVLPTVLALMLALPLLGLSPGVGANDATLPDWKEVKATKVAGGLAGPVDFAFAPDGSVWFVELYEGNVTHLDPATNKTTVMFHANNVVSKFDERGLVGLALDHDFAKNGAFYVFYTRADPAQPDGGWNRVSRIEGGKETVLLDNVTAFKRHNGGRILMMNDGNLLVSVGDNEKGSPSQDPKSLLGKILRMTRDGKPVPGNLNGGLVYTLGHRNVYGLAQHPTSGDVYATENSVGRRDEVNLLQPMANYGWPVCEGMSLAGKDDPCSDARYRLPLMQFYANHTAAPTGATFMLGQFFWASWNEGALHHLWFDDGNKQWRDRTVHETEGRIADVEVGPDGRTLWFSTWTDLWKLEFPSLPPGVEKPHLARWWDGMYGAAAKAAVSNAAERTSSNANGARTPDAGTALLLGALGLLAVASRRGR